MSRKAKVQPNHYPPPGPIGNTQGLIVHQTEANTAGGNIAPPIKPTPKEKGWWDRWGSEALHVGLDVVGLIPGVGEIADGANALVYLAEGDKVNAAISAAAMIPGAGMAATGAKYGKKVVGAVAEGVLKKGGREAAEEVAETTAEQAAKTAAAKKAKGKSGGKDKGKPKKMKCGESGKYGDLKKKSGDGKFDRDHIPSKAALKKRAEELHGRDLTVAEGRAIDRAGEAIAIPRQAHIDVSPTYGQSGANAAADAKDLAGAAKRDVDAMLEKIDEYDQDGGCKKAYKKAAKGILKKTNADLDKMLIDIVKGLK